jgi:hypothetical protein
MSRKKASLQVTFFVSNLKILPIFLEIADWPIPCHRALPIGELFSTFRQQNSKLA